MLSMINLFGGDELNNRMGWSTLKEYFDDKLIVMQIMIYSEGRNIVGKGEYDGYQYFLLLPQYFQKSHFLRLFDKQLK